MTAIEVSDDADIPPAACRPGNGGVARELTVDAVDVFTLPVGCVCPGTYPPFFSKPPRRRSNEMPPLGCAAGDAVSRGSAACSLAALPLDGRQPQCAHGSRHCRP